MSDAARDLAALSALYANDPAMTQGGGGNTSCKAGGTLLIKASGYALWQVTETEGFAEVDGAALQAALAPLLAGAAEPDEAAYNAAVAAANRSAARPSIETGLHQLIPARLVLHLHPTLAAAYVCSAAFAEDMAGQFAARRPELLVPYHPPGLGLARALNDGLARYRAAWGGAPEFILLQNHGLIVYGETVAEADAAAEAALDALAARCGADTEGGKWLRVVTRAVRAAEAAPPYVMQAQDAGLLALWRQHGPALELWPLMPDVYIYCGAPVALRSAGLPTLPGELAAFKKAHGRLPALIAVEDGLYLPAKSPAAARDAQDILLQQFTVSAALGRDARPLPEAAIAYLAGMEAEKYRQGLTAK